LPLGIVDDVVEPERELDLFRMVRFGAEFFELDEALIEVPDSVVLPVRFRIAGDEPFKDRGVRRRYTQPRPHLLPLNQTRHALEASYFSVPPRSRDERAVYPAAVSHITAENTYQCSKVAYLIRPALSKRGDLPRLRRGGRLELTETPRSSTAFCESFMLS
jgi:hypothetical protein